MQSLVLQHFKNLRPSLSCRVISDPCNIKDSWTGSHQQPTRLMSLITTETDSQDVGQASTVLLQFSPNLSHRSSSPQQTRCFRSTRWWPSPPRIYRGFS